MTLEAALWAKHRQDMPLLLELSLSEEARLSAAAERNGVEPAELARQLVANNLPPVPDECLGGDRENAAAIALLQGWMRDEATDDPVVIRQAEIELEELKRKLNANRAETGERLLFP